MKLNQFKLPYPLLIFAFVLFVYLLFAGRFQFKFPVTIYNYFSYLAEAFLHGSLSFVSSPPYLNDLTVFNGKVYMYWGPSTVLPILPFVTLFGKNISDVLYTAIIASFNPLILFLVLEQLNKLKLVILSNHQKIFLSLFFAFGTVHFYLSTNGSVWFTSQVISILFFLLSLYFITFFVHSTSITKLILASVFFGFAVISRELLMFNIPIFLTFIFISYLQNKNKIYLIQNLSIFTLVFIFIFGLNSYYNYLRFGSYFDNGHSLHKIALHFAADREKFGTFNPIYIPKNFYYMFINIPSVFNRFPYFIFNKEGDSILFTSPLLILTIAIVRKKYWHSIKSRLINGSVIISSLSIIIFLLNYFSTGWVQFGYRYILDIIPGLIILLAIVMRDFPPFLVIILFILSVIINLLGTLWFLHI